MCITYHEPVYYWHFTSQCPVTGADLSDGNDYTNIIYVHLAMDEGTGQSLQVEPSPASACCKILGFGICVNAGLICMLWYMVVLPFLKRLYIR